MGFADRRGWAATRVPALALAVGLLAGCTGDPQEQPTPAPESVALSITTVPGGGKLTSDQRADVESEVAEVLTDYVVSGFLGDYPRTGFVQSFESFTSGLTRSAARDVESLTAAPYADAESVRATRLDTRLSFLVDEGVVVGTTAHVDFVFEATVDGEVTPLELAGRLMLVDEDGIWRVFGYDVTTGDGVHAQAGATS